MEKEENQREWCVEVKGDNFMKKAVKEDVD